MAYWPKGEAWAGGEQSTDRRIGWGSCIHYLLVDVSIQVTSVNQIIEYLRLNSVNGVGGISQSNPYVCETATLFLCSSLPLSIDIYSLLVVLVGPWLETWSYLCSVKTNK